MQRRPDDRTTDDRRPPTADRRPMTADHPPVPPRVLVPYVVF
jgi:hypothetical protein